MLPFFVLIEILSQNDSRIYLVKFNNCSLQYSYCFCLNSISFGNPCDKSLTKISNLSRIDTIYSCTGSGGSGILKSEYCFAFILG